MTAALVILAFAIGLVIGWLFLCVIAVAIGEVP
jgi:hypothetical protein